VCARARVRACADTVVLITVEHLF